MKNDNKNSIYTSCRYLEYGIHFDVGGIYYCSQSLNANETQLPILPRNISKKNFYNEFLKIKTKTLKDIKDGIFPERCKNCIHIEKKLWKESSKIRYIGIFAGKRCNLDCIYCSTHKDKNFYNSIKDMPVYEILKELIEEKKISRNCHINFAGGEPTLHYEFDKILDLIIKIPNDYYIRVHTNATVYNSKIAKLLSENKMNIIISLDSCNRESYKKVKNADMFDKVINNIQKYCAKQKNNQVLLKYIIVPGINDTEEYILEFIHLVKKTGCNYACYDLDAYWYENNKNNTEEIKRINNLFEFFKKNLKQNNIYSP